MSATTTETCPDRNVGGDGVVRQCDKPEGHDGWHGQTIELRGAGNSTYRSTANWGDDGKGIHASRGRYLNGKWVPVG